MASDFLVKYLDSITQKTYADENPIVEKFIEDIKFNSSQAAKIRYDAKKYIDNIRNTQTSFVEDFIHEYSLSNEEGVAIVCLAEALLRIPDSKTAKELIEDKIKGKKWLSHVSANNSTFVNAASWGLVLTGKVLGISNSNFNPAKIIKKLGEPIVLQALKSAVKMISNEFIMGSEMTGALKNATKYIKDGYKISFDILGESARTKKQADSYYQSYIKAVSEIAKLNASGTDNVVNLSVKLTALHPKVLLQKEPQLRDELLPKLLKLVQLCHEAKITISFDAEESYRQDIYLKILDEIISDPSLKEYHGAGFVIQAYQKRTYHIIDYIVELAKKTKKKIPVRLVKGAYWDTEIKFAQEFGLEGYPVFTQKVYTDLSYIACAKKLIQNAKYIYPQFATHNAYTIAVIKQLVGRIDFEFQKLQGMGNALHAQLVKEGFKSRIYAPVGRYEDLLAYLMRRLLENGANTSFVNLLSNNKHSTEELLKDPMSIAKKLLKEPAKLPSPKGIYGQQRDSSLGFEIGIKRHLDLANKELPKQHKKKYEAYSIIAGKQKSAGKKATKEVFDVADNSKKIGEIHKASDAQLLDALDVADNYFSTWEAVTQQERSKIISKIGDVLDANKYELYSLLMREGGKNLFDAISEVREAIDFARYYAARALELCGTPIVLPGYTGERNTLSLHPRGVFLCISPWNFPLAIFAGQIMAALVCGNTVLAKAAENTSLIAARTIELMHKAGVPVKALNLMIAGGRQISEVLLKDNRIKGVCFTGSTDTALSINRALAARDTAIAPFIAETGGQNAMIVDSSALLEQTADNIIHSSFGSMGQRCSALRVAYIQEEIFEPLLELISDAMKELKIGDTKDLAIDLGPVISSSAAEELEAHVQEFKKSVLARHPIVEDSAQMSKGSFFAPTIIKLKNISELKKENFGAILHVIPFKAKDLDKVIDEVNSTGFGLTFGVQTRIGEKIQYITSKIKAGNIYANRTMIGAQVGTHPFGGENNSGTGFKAGGPHYLLRFLVERTTSINTTAIGGNIELLS